MEGIAALLGLAGLVGAWIACARYGGRRNWNGVTRHAVGALCGIFTMFIAIAIVMPADTKHVRAAAGKEQPQASERVEPSQADPKASEEARLANIRAMSDRIADVFEPEPTQLAVTHTMGSIWSEKAWANSVSLWTPDFLEKLVKAYPKQYEKVSVRFTVPVSDKYGNERLGEAMTLTFNMREIAKINWKGVTAFDVMNFAEVSVRPIGRRGVVEWCVDGNAEHARDYCMQVLH